MPQTIRTILHLSDLHIGDIDPVKGISRSNRAANLNITQFFPGNLGHDQRSVQAVADLWRSISDQGDADLVITGDLTAFGSSAHYANAGDFVDHGLAVPGQRQVLGLHQGGARGGVIPGNHDYFAGVPFPWGGTTPNMTNFFYPPGQALPRNNWQMALPDGRTLEFLAIDCDYDFRFLPANRLFAWQSGETHLYDLAARLPKDPTIVRVLLLHGSASHRDGLIRRGELLSSADSLLQHFCQTFNVVAMLCGHIHTLYLDKPATWTWRNTHELRCGTSMQLRYSPFMPAWLKRILAPNDRPHTALVHRIIFDDPKMIWEVEIQRLLSGETQFTPRPIRYQFSF